MAVTASTMLPLGTTAPAFSLPDTKGNIVPSADFANVPAFLVIFMCNHCPFVKHVLNGLLAMAAEYQRRGLAVVAINSNDVNAFGEDSPEMMARIAAEKDFTFPYLYDESQETAKAYHAACTPDFFLFDANKKLVYRGQMDDSRPGNNIAVTAIDLRSAMDAVLDGRKVDKHQKPSMGCNIKWKPGNEPKYIQ